MRRSCMILALPLLMILTWADRADAASVRRCLIVAGNEAARCFSGYVSEIEDCRTDAAAGCESTARAEGGALDGIVARPVERVLRRCSDAQARQLGSLSVEDLAQRAQETCIDFAEELLAFEFATLPDPAPAGALRCQKRLASSLRRLYRRAVRTLGRRCFVDRFAKGNCDLASRDARIDRRLRSAKARILRRCGDQPDLLGLSQLGPEASLTERVDELLARVLNRALHFAQRVYPPNDFGPTAEFGEAPVGIRTLALADPSRSNVGGTGPRPLTVELYYPSSEAAVAGVPQDVAQVLGIDVVEVPAFRDVGLAPGRFPLVVFSHGNNGIRIQSFFFAAHLASHGFIVASPDHHGNTFADTLLGVVDPNAATNRPLDMSFLIDELLRLSEQPGDFLEGSLDPNRIGASGHSFGGYTSFALAGGSFALGNFKDERIRAVLPQAPASGAFPDEFFAGIEIPILIIGGSLDETTPFPSQQQRPFDLLASGAPVVALARILDAGHFTFSDFCEVPRELLAFLGGFNEACEPRHIAWRHGQDIVKFLALAFFEGTLNADTDALARLSPANLAGIEELVYQSK